MGSLRDQIKAIKSKSVFAFDSAELHARSDAGGVKNTIKLWKHLGDYSRAVDQRPARLLPRDVPSVRPGWPTA